MIEHVFYIALTVQEHGTQKLSRQEIAEHLPKVLRDKQFVGPRGSQIRLQMPITPAEGPEAELLRTQVSADLIADREDDDYTCLNESPVSIIEKAEGEEDDGVVRGSVMVWREAVAAWRDPNDPRAKAMHPQDQSQDT